MEGPKTVTIAHAFGNSLSRLALALASSADIVEADVWLHRGRLVVRHERQLGPLPILFDRRPSALAGRDLGPLTLPLGRWYLRLALPPLTLAQVAARLDGRKELMLDLKGNDSDARAAYAEALARFLEEQRFGERTVVCGYDWELLERLGRLAPQVRVYYSANNPWRLERLREARGGEAARAVCIHHPLLDEALVGELKARGASVFTWTVDDLERARQLQRWGVDGIISNDLALLAALKEP